MASTTETMIFKGLFFAGLQVTFGSLPELQDEVDVLGYPVGGESMSVTSGVVSRVWQYSQGNSCWRCR